MNLPGSSGPTGRTRPEATAASANPARRDRRPGRERAVALHRVVPVVVEVVQVVERVGRRRARLKATKASATCPMREPSTWCDMTSGRASSRFFTHWYGRITCTNGRTDRRVSPPRRRGRAGRGVGVGGVADEARGGHAGRGGGTGSGTDRRRPPSPCAGAAIITIRRYSRPRQPAPCYRTPKLRTRLHRRESIRVVDAHRGRRVPAGPAI